MARTKRAGQIRIGTSGWIYGHWRGLFYPKKLPQAQWFAFYAEHFNTVEINNTFYRLSTPETFDAWREQAPREFLYAVKCNRFLTHNLKLTKAAEPLERFYSRTARLKGHLGPLLYQLPPRWRKNVDRLDEFLSQLPRRWTHVVEFREPSWLASEVYDCLIGHKVSLCVHDLLPNHPRHSTGPAAYVRFHGTQGKYAGSYTDAQLKSWAKWLHDRAAAGFEAYAYFNNDQNAAAVKNALRLRELVGS